MTKSGLFFDYEREFRRKVIQHTVAATKGNHSEAARILGLERAYFARLFTTLGLRRGDLHVQG